MLAFEQRFGIHVDAKIHMHGLRHMVFSRRARDGLHVFDNNPLLDLQLCWIDLTTTGSTAARMRD